MKRALLASLTILGLLLADAVAAQTIEKCQAGKKKCVIRKVKGLLGCHAKAEAKGEPVLQSCVDKVVAKFSHPLDGTGCIEKIEAKGGCSIVGDAAVLETKVDAFVLAVVQDLDPGYPAPVLNKCSAGKKKCVAKKATGLLGCHAKADTAGTLDFKCLVKVRQKFDGSFLVPPNAAAGCFEKLEGKEKPADPATVCLTHDDTAAVEATVDAFVNDVVRVLDPTGGPQIDPQTFTACEPACAGAHCVPKGVLSTLPLSTESCIADGGSAGDCVPDPIIAAAGQFVPATCTSIAGAEGRCLPTCLPAVAAVLPQDVCAADERCMPCFNPSASDPTAPTGACSFGGDMPSQPPVELTCPWSGPPVFDPTAFAGCSPTCGGSHCVPTGLLSSLPVSPEACTATGGAAGECVPDAVITAGGQSVPGTCTSIAGAEGRCLSTCLPAVAATVGLPQAVCDAGERCMPCYDPTSSDPTAATGACSFACDAPSQDPVLLSCPWEGPPVFNPSTFAACSPACGGAHCVPAGIVPVELQSLLATCTDGLCAPDTIISTAGNFDPPTCVAFAGTTAEGRCLSSCLPDIAAQPSLAQSTCAATQRCAPCTDPFTGASTGVCTLSCDAPQSPPFTFPGCCSGAGRCVPSSLAGAVPAYVGLRDCPTGTANYQCLALDQVPGLGVTPTSCDVAFSVIPPFSWTSACVPDCVLGDTTFIPQGTCPAGSSCPPP
jgi:hypothetical protein